MTREVVILEHKWCFMMGPCVPAQAIMEQICKQIKYNISVKNTIGLLHKMLF